MVRRMVSAFSGEKSMVWSKVKVVATGRIVDAGIFMVDFCAIFLVWWRGGFSLFYWGFCESEWQEDGFLWSLAGEKCGKAGL